MLPSTLLCEEVSGCEGNIGLITLNRPEALNSLTHEMIIGLHQQLLVWETASHIKAVIIRATAGRAFCAGGDIRLVYKKKLNYDPTLIQFFCDEYRLNHYIYHYSKPYISLLDGITMGGGAGISIHGSHRIGTEHLVFAMPETSIGFFPDVGATFFLSRLANSVGIYLGLTGTRLACDDCLEIKLIDYKVTSKSLPLIIDAIAKTPLKDNPKLTVNYILSQFHQPVQQPPLSAYFQRISQHFSKLAIEDIIASLESEDFTWCQETAALLRKKSPTSLKVTLHQLHEGLKRDFDQCMQLEYHLMSHFIQAHDFFEGIRAAIIEKDQTPQWRPAKLSDINQQSIDLYFTPPTNHPAQLLFI